MILFSSQLNSGFQISLDDDVSDHDRSVETRVRPVSESPSGNGRQHLDQKCRSIKSWSKDDPSALGQWLKPPGALIFADQSNGIFPLGH
jgi:hypothetical protein